jgi:hypothetical protein
LIGIFADEIRACGRQKGKQFFLEKKNKNFCTYGARFRIDPRQRHKSLLLLFFRKEALAF